MGYGDLLPGHPCIAKMDVMDFMRCGGTASSDIFEMAAWVKQVAPWCYIEDTNPPAWEYCDVSFCELRIEIGGKGHVYPECRLSEKGIEYVGGKNETENGKSCQRWDVDTRRLQELTYPYSFSFYDFTKSISPENHCRNTGQLDRPWCMVSDLNTVWEYCDIPVCENLDPLECKLSPSGIEYVGKLNVTISGYPCKPWLEVCAKKPSACEWLGSRFPDELDGKHRFCRNKATLYHGPWCFTYADDGIEWEYCEVPFCPPTDQKRCDIRVGGRSVRIITYRTLRFSAPFECKVDEKGVKYIGTKNVTRKGFKCQPWLSNSPNNQLLIIDYEPSYTYDERSK
ncbi:unnamed protein product [Darwinula stevensoni]|uniref:Kringle domain-containing protein n=1 Tax=Darwinula stevensoni TaxID=69355 RepID=A0A7R9AE79_9CRUS|nr:unnamed protein product [Darwinula stevensoni]CAG0901823.1 unnamed protein product [Darwinula stevensoni]